MRFDRQPGQAGDRIGDDLVDRLPLVDDAVDERSVGAVFEQAAHQIGEQFFVAADRGVDPAGPTETLRADDLLVKRLAHAVQALEFPVAAFAGEFEDGRYGVCVVGRELRIEGRATIEQAPGAGEIADVGGELARVDWVAVEPALLAALDLAVPVGALDQADHQPPLAAPGEIGKPVDKWQGALLVGLDGKAKPVPAGKAGGKRQYLDQIERQIEAIGLLGVDRKADAGISRTARQRQQTRPHLGQNAIALRHFVARVQGRELNRNARRFDDRPGCGGAPDRGDGVIVSREIARRIGRGMRGLAEHIVGMSVALMLGRAGALERFLDCAPHDELAGEDAHRRRHRLAHHRLARASREAAQGGTQIMRLGLRMQQPPGQHQRPGRGVDEHRFRMAEMARPVGLA